MCRRASSHPCVMRLSDCLFSSLSSPCSLPCVSPISSSSWTLTSTCSSSMRIHRSTSVHSANWGVWPLANVRPLKLQSTWYAEESPQAKKWWLQNHSGRWHDDDKYRKSLSFVGWTEQQIIQYDTIALEDQSYVAAWQDSSRNGTDNPGKFLWMLKVFKGH